MMIFIRTLEVFNLFGNLDVYNTIFENIVLYTLNNRKLF